MSLSPLPLMVPRCEQDHMLSSCSHAHSSHSPFFTNIFSKFILTHSKHYHISTTIMNSKLTSGFARDAIITMGAWDPVMSVTTTASADSPQWASDTDAERRHCKVTHVPNKRTAFNPQIKGLPLFIILNHISIPKYPTSSQWNCISQMFKRTLSFQR